MKVLAIDVSGPGGGAALLAGGRVTMALVPTDVRRGRTLVPLIEGLLQAADLRVPDLDLIACGVGPGSFTGIRIGIATAATLAYAAGLEVAGVCSLRGIACSAPPNRRDVLVALDARRDRIYAARFKDGALVGEYGNITPQDAVADLPRDAFVLGDGRTRYAEWLGAFDGTADAPVRPDAIARIAAEKGEPRIDPRELRPLYLRLSDPELRRMA